MDGPLQHRPSIYSELAYSCHAIPLYFFPMISCYYYCCCYRRRVIVVSSVCVCVCARMSFTFSCSTAREKCMDTISWKWREMEECVVEERKLGHKIRLKNSGIIVMIYNYMVFVYIVIQLIGEFFVL